MTLDLYHAAYKKKLTQNEWKLNLRAEIRTVRRKQENLHDIGFGNDFLDMTAKVQATKNGLHQNEELLCIKGHLSKE